MKEYIIPSTNFIGAWFIADKVCDGLISYFDESPDQGPGEIGQGVNEKYKVSTDVAVIPRVKDERIQLYLDTLGRVCDNYTERYPWCSTNHAGWGINTNFNIQRYNPGEGFYGWHTERSTYKDLIGTRHLTFMTYLNDVTDGGETEWYHQGLKIQPQKGLTVIWPCDWTHTHRGVPSSTQVKYITTGWYTYKVEGFDYTEFNGG